MNDLVNDSRAVEEVGAAEHLGGRPGGRVACVGVRPGGDQGVYDVVLALEDRAGQGALAAVVEAVDLGAALGRAATVAAWPW